MTTAAAPTKLSLTKTTIGKKVLMALSGLAMVGFLVTHLAGNLNIFLGPEAINGYAAGLRKLGPLLWILRLGLLGAVLVHVGSAFSLWNKNRNARTSRYAMKESLATNYAARTMYWTGPIVFLYILFHLAHLTAGQTLGLYEHDPHNVYNNLVYGFQIPWLTAIYIVANLAVVAHIFHGIWSACQSIGASHPRYNHLRNAITFGICGLLLIGNLAIPLGVLSGAVEPTNQTFCYPELATVSGECDGRATSLR